MAQGDGDHTLLYTHVGRAVRDARLRRSMTQEQLASAVGLTRTSVTNIEKGRQKVRLDTLYDIAEVLGESPHDLLPQATAGRIDNLGAAMPSGFSDAEQEWIRSLARGAQPGDTNDRSKEEDS